ncbi:TPM domain-containing protein [Lactococcus ileimucosae]|uniref:TPM domain-containing protein n=1 Tax=Lactococcus ileimucosae TaxID=2941329 RepID=UPI0020447FD1|nr:TPM domain-containing protein [Lactococcus ileimucosae]
MKKKITFLSLFLTLFAVLTLFGFSKTVEAQQIGIDDQAGILEGTPSVLTEESQRLSEKTKAGVFVVTTTTNTQAPKDFAVDYLANKVGQGNNGIVLLIDMGQREIYIWATGNLKHYITPSRIDSILDVVQPQLSNGNYQQAIEGFYEQVNHYYQQGIPGGRQYSVNPNTGEVTFHRSFRPAYILIAVIAALISAGAFVVVLVSRYQLKLGARWNYEYQKNGALKLSKRSDTLVNSFITTRRIPRNNNSSGGGFSGGGGGSGGGRSF